MQRIYTQYHLNNVCPMLVMPIPPLTLTLQFWPEYRRYASSHVNKNRELPLTNAVGLLVSAPRDASLPSRMRKLPCLPSAERPGRPQDPTSERDK